MEKRNQLTILLLLLLLGLAACKGSRNGGKDQADNPDKDTPEQVERLIFHTGTCFGACPEYCMSVDRKGKVEMWGGLFSRLSGYYSAQLPENELVEWRKVMDEAGWDSLKTNYQANWTDDRTVSIALVKGGRIVKSIRDYGSIAGAPASTAYERFAQLYEKLEMEPMAPEALTCWPFQETPMNVEGNIWRLLKSEQFFLWQEWRHTGSLTGSFVRPFTEATEPHYMHNPGRFPGLKAPRLPNCVQNSPTPIEVTTNGQSFTIRYDSGDQIQIDLGYNFFKENEFVYRPLK